MAYVNDPAALVCLNPACMEGAVEVLVGINKYGTGGGHGAYEIWDCPDCEGTGRRPCSLCGAPAYHLDPNATDSAYCATCVRDLSDLGAA